MIAWKSSRVSPIGLHLGPRSATLVQLAGEGDGREVRALARGELSCDENASPEEQDRQVAAALRKLVADHSFQGRQIVSCLGGHELFVQNVRLPQLPPEEVEKVVSWEAEERLPYPVADAEIRHLLAGQVRQDANVKQEVILLACHRGVIDRRVAVLEQAGLSPCAIDVEPCAIVRCLRHGNGEASKGTRYSYLNLGQTETSVIFADEDQILFLKSIAQGGSHLDKAVARHLGLDLKEAARLRARVTASATLEETDEVHRSVIEAIRSPLESMASEIELCLRYHKVTFRGKTLDGIVVTGSEASPWLAEFLSERLNIPYEMGDPFATLAGRSPEENAPERPWEWTTAMGLSLR